ncbi:MAG: hypothetical protein EOO99_06195 [Pedobacter sp.]|nr:MAG: hypothetical protein EOO99_06195 [Pedobacter sp.]
MKTKSILFGLGLMMFTLACKKDDDKKPTPPPTTTKTRADLTRDSIFLYAKQVYYWNDALPTLEAFDVTRFKSASTDLRNYENELVAITQLKINPATGKPYEYYQLSTGVVDSKFSYISDKTNRNPTAYIHDKKSAVDLEGNGNDFGLKLGAYLQENLDGSQYYAYFVQAVYPGSPADKAGMVRSHRIYKVNDRAVGEVGGGSSEISFINNAMNGGTVKLEGVKYLGGVSGTSYTANLTKAVYKSTPVIKTRVITAGTKNIGYFAFARFSNLNSAKADIDAAFKKFADSNVTDLIIDLRYNGGGYVNTAQYILNQVAPQSAHGKVMFAEHYNSMMQNKEAGILVNQPFRDANDNIVYQNGRMVTYFDFDYSVNGNTEVFMKAGPFNTASNVGKVVFIVSGSSASASELLINALKPYMNVKLVGTKTYGKPIGFFPITLENRYEVYYSLFATKNALGQGDYYDGFTPDIVDSFDDPRNNFGDPYENYIAKAIKEIAPGMTVTANINKTMQVKDRETVSFIVDGFKPVVDGNEFIGMIETKFKMKEK